MKSLYLIDLSLPNQEKILWSSSLAQFMAEDISLIAEPKSGRCPE